MKMACLLKNWFLVKKPRLQGGPAPSFPSHDWTLQLETASHRISELAIDPNTLLYASILLP